MNEYILVAVAWPYANGYAHLGHIAGAYLPADIFARYQRLRGNQVLMVSGSESHGTPVTFEADRSGIPPRERDPQCKLARPGDPPHKVVVRESEHFYLDLPAEAGPLLAWFEQQSALWRPNVSRFAHNYVANGLQPRAITRDIDWGVPVPVEGWA